MINRILNSSIHNKLTLMMTFISLMTSCIIFAVFIVYDFYSFRTSMMKELTIVSDIIGKRSAPALHFERYQKIKENLGDLQSKESILVACVYDMHGKRVADYNNSSVQYNLCPTAEGVGHTFEDGYLKMFNNIVSSNSQKVGTMYIQADMHEFHRHVTSLGVNLLFLFTLVTIAIYFVARRVQRIISVPIRSLKEAALAISEGNSYSQKAQKYYHDEIGDLTDTYNHMMETINIRDQELKKINDSLEAKVKARTADLKLQKLQAEEAKQRAEEANEVKSEFLRNISHELVTPLHGIQSFSEYGKREYQEADRDTLGQYFQTIGKSTDRLAKLVSGILDISCMEGGKQKFIMEKADLHEVLLACANEQSALFKKSGINLVYKKPKCKTAIIFDKNKIAQLVINLLGNAVKFTPRDKSVFITAKSGKHNDVPSIIVSIADEGIGIPEDQLEDVFTKFTQSDRTKKQSGGKGIGLALCKGIMQGHAGAIWAENNKSGGAKFSFSIPKTLSEGIKTLKPTEL